MRVRDAIADAVRKLQRIPVPLSIRLGCPVQPEDLVLRKNLINGVAKICDDVIAAVASEAAEQSNQISRGDFMSVTRDALQDEFLLAQFDDAIRELEEIAANERAPPCTVRACEKLSA